MPWTIPDKGESQDVRQSILFQEDLEVLVAGIRGIDCVLSGCAVTAQGSPDMTVAVAKGSVLSNGVLKPVTAGNATITTADSTYPRIDLVVVNSSGTKAVRAGTAAAAPKPPARTANDVVLAQVWVPAGDTTISPDQIVDRRVIQDTGPITLYKTVAAETTNTTSGVIEMLNKAASGVTIPSGLFLAGKIIRVRIGGNYLMNSGTPTITISVLYGGTTMFSDVSAAGVASATRGAFVLEFDMVAQANNDQSLAGHLQITDPTNARTAPGSGIGELWSAAANMEAHSAFAGAAAIDSDAADRVLSVRWTFNVSNAANELVVETATVEIL